MILRIAGQRKKVATGIKLFPELWNIESQQINNLTTKLKDFLKKKYGGDLPTKNKLINYQERIYGLKNQVEGIESGFDYDGVTYSATMVVVALQKTKTSKVKKEDGANLIDQYIKENEHTRATGSLKVYKTLKRHLQNYQATTKQIIRPDQLDHAFVQSFQNFLINWEEVHKTTSTVRRLNNITIAKQLTTLNALLNYAKRNGVEISNGYKDFIIKGEKLEVIALNQNELDGLFNLDLSKDKRLDQVRDVFCFSCVTGFRYSDLEQLRRENIKEREIRLTIKKQRRP